MDIIYRKKYLFLFGSGIIFALPFLFPQLHIISFFAAVPLFYIFFRELTHTKSKAVKLKAFTWYIIIFAMSFYLLVYIWFLWFYPLDFAGLSSAQSMFVTICAWWGFPIIQTIAILILPIGLFLMRNIGSRKPFMLPLFSASLYVVVEWVQSWFLTGLTWAKLSISQYQNLYAIQSISVFGTYFTSFIIIFINANIALYLCNKSNKSSKDISAKKNNALILMSVLIYLLNICFGVCRVAFYQYPEDMITAQIVQGNLSSVEKWENTGAMYSIEKHTNLAVENIKLKKPDISVWSETAVPASVYYKSRIYNILSDIAIENDISIITGVFFDDLENDKQYNSIMAFLPPPNEDIFITPYNKRHLVPFGEYLPLENLLSAVFPFVANMTMFDATINWGEGDNLIEIDGVKYGGLVCFDSIFPELARSSVRAGANILVVVTNDSWYKDSIGIYQHNAQSVLRAVENNRYVIRSANTGISSFISPIGEILMKTEVNQDEVITCDVGVIEGNKTIYTLCGDIILYFAAVCIIACVILNYFVGRGDPDTLRI